MQPFCVHNTKYKTADLVKNTYKEEEGVWQMMICELLPVPSQTWFITLLLAADGYYTSTFSSCGQMFMYFGDSGLKTNDTTCFVLGCHISCLHILKQEKETNNQKGGCVMGLMRRFRLLINGLKWEVFTGLADCIRSSSLDFTYAERLLY